MFLLHDFGREQQSKVLASLSYVTIVIFAIFNAQLLTVSRWITNRDKYDSSENKNEEYFWLLGVPSGRGEILSANDLPSRLSLRKVLLASRSFFGSVARCGKKRKLFTRNRGR